VNRVRGAAAVVARPAGASAAIGAAVYAVFPQGFANYDTLYALVWGQQLGRGEAPQYDLPIAPTPHPLAELLGLILSPLSGAHAEDASVVIAYLVLGILGYLLFRLGQLWFSWPVGVVAALLFLTREPVLSYGVRAYVDLPYLAFVLGALVLETKRPRAGAPVLVLLGLAGLLRPEAWLLSAAYLAWLWPARPRAGVLGLAALAAVAPVLWGLSDLLVTGNPFWSLTQTRHTADTLRRVTGLDHVPTTMPRRLGEILREPVLVAAAGGGLLSLAWLRARALLGFAAGVVAVAAFCILAAAGLPIVTRYVFLPAAILAVFAGAGVFGWRSLDADDAHRRQWMVLSLVVVALLAAYGPSQIHRLQKTSRALALQQRIRDDLGDLVSQGVISPRCGSVAVPNHRAVPLLAARLEIPPARVVSAQLRRPTTGTYLAPANAEVERNFLLDPHDPGRFTASAPRGFSEVARNRSWRVLERCG
jgi:hypothetical protein